MLLKESWWSKDPHRRGRGKDLREAFLNMYASKTESEMSSIQNKKHTRIVEDEDMEFCLSNARQRRTLKSPESRYVSPLDLTRYAQMNEISERRVKTKSDDEILKNQHAVNIAESQRNYSNYLDKLIELTNEQLQRYTMFFRRKKESFLQRKTLVDAAYESRKAYVDDSLTSERAKAKERKSKKD